MEQRKVLRCPHTPWLAKPRGSSENLFFAPPNHAQLYSATLKKLLQYPAALFRQHAALGRVTAVDREPNRDGLAVTQLVAGERLELVCGPMPVVERLGGAVLEWIAALGDVLHVQLGRAAHEHVGGDGLAAREALGGFAAMALQIVWFRFLIAHFGPYRPVFSLLVGVILLGIWLGSQLGGALAQRTRQPERIHALALLGFGLIAAAALLWAPADSSARFRALANAAPGGPWPLYRSVLGGALGMVALPALLSGAAYPLANALVQRRLESVGARAGALYLGNTLGSVAGSLAGGFWLLPALGMQGAVGVVLGALALALLCLAAASGARGRTLGWLGAATALLLAACAAWQTLPSDLLLRRSITQGLGGKHARITALREGVNETLVVVESPLGETLFTNGFGMSGTTFLGQRYMRAFVHLPMLLRDGIENVMVMCFGVGNTVSAALLHAGVKRVDVVDLSRDILEHAGHFAAVNGDVLADPRVRVHVNDARHHLRMLSEPTYDLITGEPPPLPRRWLPSRACCAGTGTAPGAGHCSGSCTSAWHG